VCSLILGIFKEVRLLLHHGRFGFGNIPFCSDPACHSFFCLFVGISGRLSRLDREGSQDRWDYEMAVLCHLIVELYVSVEWPLSVASLS